MKAIGLLSLILGIAALFVQPDDAQAGARPAFRSPMRLPFATPPGGANAQNARNCNRRRLVGGSFYGASWISDTAGEQQDAPPPAAPPPPPVSYVFVEAPANAPAQERLGPRIIAVDRRTIATPSGGRPLVIYGDTLY